MQTDDIASDSERDQTDESLRLERDRADEELAAVDEAADDVIRRARRRADEVLATARAKVDRPAGAPLPSSAPPAGVQGQRVLEDRVLRRERANADETLSDARAEQRALLQDEREATDKDLSSERAGADAAVASRDDFLGIVSHDLRNLLHTIGVRAALIQRVGAGPSAEPVRNHAHGIQRAAGRMMRLIGDLVDVASIEAGAFALTREMSDPADVVAEAVSLFEAPAAAGGVSLTKELGIPLAPAAFDPARILQVLSNLLGNALKFTPAGGAVVVRAERVGTDVRFAVSDTGVGIHADGLATVFERFVRAGGNDRRGVGLGLYISRCIVQGHGGRIWAESTLGVGSTFRFTLPVSVAREASGREA